MVDGEPVQRALERLAPRVGLRGFAAGLSAGGDFCWSMASGPANRAGQEVTATTLFPLASLTKPVAATLLLRLVERGALDLDAAASGLISDQPSAHRQMIRSSPAITVRHLLTHTAAIPAIATFRRKPTGDPGVHYRYSGAAFGVLTDVIETVGGAPFADQLVREILEPCAMSDTFVGASGARGAGFGVRLSEPVGRPGLLGRLLEPAPAANAAAGLVSTVRDYLRFDAELAHGELVNASTLAAMWTPMTLRSGHASPYGLGFFVQTIGGERVVWHYGYQPGHDSALYLRFSDRDLAFVVLANTDALGRDGKLGDGDLTRSSVARAVIDAAG